jgi:hypothetical protein
MVGGTLGCSRTSTSAGAPLRSICVGLMRRIRAEGPRICLRACMSLLAAPSARASDAIAELARTKRGVAFDTPRDFLDRRVRDGVSDNICERSSSMKNRKR